jgi:hypothetical protein
MDAAKLEQAVLLGISEGGAMGELFAASPPEADILDCRSVPQSLLWLNVREVDSAVFVHRTTLDDGHDRF